MIVCVVIVETPRGYTLVLNGPQLPCQCFAHRACGTHQDAIQFPVSILLSLSLAHEFDQKKTRYFVDKQYVDIAYYLV